MSDAYAIVHIPKSLSIHGMALTSTDRKIEHRKVVADTQTSKGKETLDHCQKVKILLSSMCSSPFIKTLTVAISVYCFFMHILKKVLPISKKESGCIPPRLGDTLLDSRIRTPHEFTLV